MIAVTVITNCICSPQLPPPTMCLLGGALLSGTTSSAHIFLSLTFLQSSIALSFYLFLVVSACFSNSHASKGRIGGKILTVANMSKSSVCLLGPECLTCLLSRFFFFPLLISTAPPRPVLSCQCSGPWRRIGRAGSASGLLFSFPVQCPPLLLSTLL